MYKSHKLQKDPNSKLSSRRSLLLLNLASAGRLLTSVFDTRDPLLVTSYGLGCVLDFVAISQVLHYRRRRRQNSLLASQSDDVDEQTELTSSQDFVATPQVLNFRRKRIQHSFLASQSDDDGKTELKPPLKMSRDRCLTLHRSKINFDMESKYLARKKYILKHRNMSEHFI